MTNDDDSRTKGNRITISTVCCYIHISESRLDGLVWFGLRGTERNGSKLASLMDMFIQWDGMIQYILDDSMGIMRMPLYMMLHGVFFWLWCAKVD